MKRVYRNPLVQYAQLGDLERTEIHVKKHISYVDMAARFAASHGHVDVVRFLEEKSPTLIDFRTSDDIVINNIARFGHLDMLKYLYESHKISLTPQAFINAVENGRYTLLKYMMENDCPLPQSDLAKVIHYGVPICKGYLLSLLRIRQQLDLDDILLLASGLDDTSRLFEGMDQKRFIENFYITFLKTFT